MDTENLNFTNDSFEQEKQMLKDRDLKVLEAKNLCRFCLESDKNKKCVSISKLETFLKDSVDCLKLLDVESELLSEIVCERCFETLVEFDAFRKGCQKAQNDFFQEIQEIDEKIQEIRDTQQKEQTVWYKQEMIDEANLEEVVEEIDHSFLIEEHLEDEVYENSYEQNYSEHSIAIEEDKNNLSEMIEEDFEEEHNLIAAKSSLKMEHDEFFDSKDIYGVDKDVVIKNPERNIFAYRIYECFFCKLKFAGRKNYKVSQLLNF